MCDIDAIYVLNMGYIIVLYVKSLVCFLCTGCVRTSFGVMCIHSSYGTVLHTPAGVHLNLFILRYIILCMCYMHELHYI